MTASLDYRNRTAMIRILPNGGTMYTQSPTSNTIPTRSECKGWSRSISRRNTDFLLSVDAGGLTGYGYALSLTIRDCPETPQVWQSVRRKFVKRLKRSGMIRMHWLTEWQRRGCPHLHAAVWFDECIDPGQIIRHWLQSAKAHYAGPFSQDAKLITGVAGWFEYLAKHAARSVSNYQRSPENIPEQWGGKTGRMWGHLGEWPVTESKDIEPPIEVEQHYRRLMIRYQMAKARRQGDSQRFQYLRRYLSRAPAATSRSVALPRLWIPEDDQWALLRCAFDSHAPNRPGDSERVARPHR